MTLLADLISKDPLRVWSASCAIRKMRDPKQLAALAEHTTAIQESARDLLARNAGHASASQLEFALRKLAHVSKSKECLCSLYLVDDLFNPKDEAQQGHIRITDSLRGNDNEIELYKCQCAHCGTRFQVEENNYYHTWWAWRHVRKTSSTTAMKPRAPTAAPVQSAASTAAL